MAHSAYLHDAGLYSACCQDLLKQLVCKYCPVYYFHSKEQFFPCSIEWYATQSELRLLEGSYKEPEKYKVLKKQGEVNLDVIKAAQEEHNPEQLVLYGGKETHVGGKDHLDDVPVYVHWKVVAAKDGSVEALEINYCLLYAFNGPHPIMSSLKLNQFELGSHVGDWEHMTFRCEPKEGKLLGVWYNTHRNRDGQWLAASDVPRTSDGRILAYVALHSHGSWPEIGVMWRVLGVVNDLTDSHGIVWRPKKCIVVTETLASLTSGSRDGGRCLVPCCSSRGSSLNCGPCDVVHCDAVDVVDEGAEWMQFRGFYGGVRAPCEQKWFKEAEPPMSRTTFERVFRHSKPECKDI